MDKGCEKTDFLFLEDLKSMIKRTNMLEKTSERQLKLALLLGMAAIDCSTLAEQLGVTKKTLLTDIAFFNHTYAPVCINTDKYQVASLLLPPEINLEDLIKQIFNQSTNIQMLQMIFEVEPTLSKLANKLYLSETSIRRIIANINTYFCEINAPLSIHISSKLKIIGDESYIRQFFCSMFREQYTPQQLPHFYHIFDVLQRYYKKQATHQTISTYKVIINSFYLYTAIIRIGQGHLISENKGNPINDPSFFEIIKNNTVFCSIIEKEYGFNVTTTTVSNLLDKKIYFPCVQSALSSQGEYQRIRQFSEYFYRSLSQDFSLNQEGIQKLSELINYNKNRQFFKTTYLQILSEILFTHSPQILKAYNQAIDHAGLMMIKRNQLLYEELLLELISLSPALLTTVFPYKKKVSILIVSYQEERTLALYKQLLFKKIPAIHRIHTYTDNIFQVNYDTVNQYDLVLTDIELNQAKTKAKMIKISKIPTTSFWNNIETVLYT